MSSLNLATETSPHTQQSTTTDPRLTLIPRENPLQKIRSLVFSEATGENQFQSQIEKRLNERLQEGIVPLNQLIQRDVVTTNQSYFTRVAGGFWSTNDKGEIKAHGDFVAVCVEGAINQWKQVPQAKVSEGQDRLDLFAMGVLEKLYPLLGISPQTLAGLQPDRVAAIYKELGTLVDQVETVAAASLFAHWEKHGYPKGVTREMVSQAGTPLAAFKAIYRNGRTSVDLATWDYGQSVGEVMQEIVNSTTTDEKSSVFKVRDQTMKFIFAQEPDRYPTMEKRIHEAIKARQQNQEYVPIDKPIPADLLTNQSQRSKDLERYFSQIFGPNREIIIVPRSNFARIVLPVWLERQQQSINPQGGQKPVDLMAVGIIEELLKSWKISDHDLASLDKQQLDEILDNIDFFVSNLQTITATQYFPNLLEKDAEKQFKEKVIHNRLYNSYELGRLTGQAVKPVLTELDFHRPEILEPPQLKIVTLGEVAAQPKAYEPLSIELPQQSEVPEPVISFEHYYQHYGTRPLHQKLYNYHVLEPPLVEKPPAFKKSVDQFYDEDGKPVDKFAYWIVSGWKTVFGQFDALEVGLITALRRELHLEETDLPDPHADSETQRAFISRLRSLKPRFDDIKQLIDHDVLKDDRVEKNPRIASFDVGLKAGETLRNQYYEHCRDVLEQEAALVQRQQTETALVEQAIEGRFPHEHEETMNRTQRALAKTSRFLTKVWRGSQKLTSPHEGTTMLKKGNVSLKRTVASVGLGGVTAEAYRVLTDLAETSRFRIVQYGLIGGGYLVGTLGLRRPWRAIHDFDFHYLGKAAVRGVASAALIAGVYGGYRLLTGQPLIGGVAEMTLAQQLSEHLHLAPEVARLLPFLQFPFGLTVAKMAGSGLLSSLGINRSTESILNSILDKKGELDEAVEFLYYRDRGETDIVEQINNRHYQFRKRDVVKHIFHRKTEPPVYKPPPWQPLQNFLDGAVQTPGELIEALEKAREYRAQLEAYFLHNPSRYEKRQIGRVEAEENPGKSEKRLIEKLRKRKAEKKGVVYEPKTRKLGFKRQDVIDNRKMIDRFGQIEADIFRRAQRNLTGTDQQRVLSHFENQEIPRQAVQKLREKVGKRRILNTVTALVPTVAIVAVLNIPVIKEWIAGLQDELLGKATSVFPRLSLHGILPARPEQQVTTLFTFQPENQQANYVEVVNRIDELNNIIALLTDDKTPASTKMVLQSQYNLTMDDVATLEKQLGDITLSETQLLIRTAQQSKKTIPLLDELAVKLSGSKKTDLGKMVQAITAVSQKQHVASLNPTGTPINTVANALKTLVDDDSSKSFVAMQDQTLLDRLGIERQTLESQLSFLPATVTDAQKDAIANNPAPFFIDSQALPGKTLVVIDGQGTTPLVGVFDPKDNPNFQFHLEQIQAITKTPDDQVKLALAVPGLPKSLSEPSTDTPYFALVKAQLVRCKDFSEKPDVIDQLIKAAHGGNLEAFNKITAAIKTNDLYQYNKIFNDPLHNPPVSTFTTRVLQETQTHLSSTLNAPPSTAHAIAQSVRNHLNETSLTSTVSLKGKPEIDTSTVFDPIVTQEKTVGQLLNGQITPDEATRAILDTSEPDIFFINGKGKVTGQFRQHFNLPLDRFPPQFTDWAVNVEGPAHQTGIQFLTTLFVRNVAGSTQSGGSDPGMQLWELFTGGPGQISLNPLAQNVSLYYDESRYNLQYLARLVDAIALGEVPKDMQPLLGDETSQLPHNPFPTKAGLLEKVAYHRLSQQIPKIGAHLKPDEIAKICWKMEGYVFSRALIAKHGEEAVTTAWLNSIPFAAVDLPIYGVEAAAQAYFGKSINDLEDYQQVILIGMIQAPGTYSPVTDPNAAIERALTVVANLEGIKTDKRTDLLRTIKLPFYDQTLMAPKDKISHELAESLRAKLKLLLFPDSDNLPTKVRVQQIEIVQRRWNELFTNRIPDAWQNQIPPDFDPIHNPQAQQAFAGVKDAVKTLSENPDATARFTSSTVIVTRSEDGTTFFIKLPEETKPPFKGLQVSESLIDPQTYFSPEVYEGPSLQIPFVRQMQEAIKPVGDHYQITLPDGKTVDIPAFIKNGQSSPGFQAVLYDANTDSVSGLFSGAAELASSPLTPGSTIKPFTLAFLLTHTNNTLDSIIDNRPGIYSLISNLRVDNFMSGENILDLKNQISLAQALAASTNVPFMKLMKEYLQTHPNGWQEYTIFLHDNFGIDLVDSQGQLLTQPTAFAPIGADAKINSLEQLAAAYARLANPQEYFNANTADGQKLIQVSQQIVKVLGDESLKTKPIPAGVGVWGQGAVELFRPNDVFVGAKTGTAPLDDKSVGAVLAAAIFRNKDGKMMTAAVQLQGEKNGIPTPIPGTGANNGLPIARVVGEGMFRQGEYSMAISDYQTIIQNMGNIWHDQDQLLQQQPTVLQFSPSSQPLLYDRFGNVIKQMVMQADGVERALPVPVPNLVDKIGPVENGFQPVVVHTENGKIMTAFLKVDPTVIKEVVPTVGLAQRDSVVIGQLQQLLQKTITDHKFPVPPSVNFVVIHDQESSPLLQSIAYDLNRRNLLAMTSEDVEQLTKQLGLPENTVFINETMAKDMLAGNSSQETLGEILYHETEHQKQRLLLAAVDSAMTLDQLFWKHGQALPSKSMLEAFTEYRLKLSTTPAYEADAIMKKILDPTDPQMQRSHQAYNLYADLMKAVDENKPVDPTKAKQFVALINEINQEPNRAEMLALNFAPVDDRPIQQTVAVAKPDAPNAPTLIKPTSETTIPPTAAKIAQTAFTPELKILETASQAIEAINPPEILRKSFVAIKDGQIIAVNPDEQYPLWSLIKLPLAAWAIKHYGDTDPLINVAGVGKIPMSIAIRDYLLSFSSETAYLALQNFTSQTTDWDQGALKMATEFQKELGMINVTYDSKDSLFHGSANDFVKLMNKIFKTDYLTDDQKQLLLTGMSNQANHQQVVTQYNMLSESDFYYKFGIGPNNNSYSANTLGGTQTGGWWFIALSENKDDAMTQSSIDWQKKALDIAKAEFSKPQAPPPVAVDTKSGG